MMKALVAVFILAATAAAGQTTGPAAEPAPLTCLLAPARTSDIGSPAAGVVREVPVSRSDYVAAGDLLVRLDQSLARADLAATEIRIEGLRARIDRSARLGETNLIPIDELEQIRTELKLAQAEADRARLELEQTEIRAPFAGYVADIDVAPGELTGAEPLLRLIDVSVLDAEMVFVDEALGQIATGDRVRLAVDRAGTEVDAEVTAIDSFVDPASNTFTVVAEVDNADLSLPSGLSCRVAAWPE